MTYLLGRRPRLHDARIPHLSALRLGGKPEPIKETTTDVNWTSKLRLNELGMMLNDQWGCCVPAGAYHALQVWSSQTNTVDGMITEPDACVLKAYSEATGFNPAAGPPGSNPTDQGTDMQSFLHYWLTEGLPTGPGATSRHRLLGALEVDPRNQDDVIRAVWECGVVYLGFNVPSYLMGIDGAEPIENWSFPQPAGSVGTTDSDGGHCVIVPRANADGPVYESWGSFYGGNWAFWLQYVDEAYALLDLDWLTATGVTPLGRTVGQWAALMAPFTEGPPPRA